MRGAVARGPLTFGPLPHLTQRVPGTRGEGTEECARKTHHRNSETEGSVPGRRECLGEVVGVLREGSRMASTMPVTVAVNPRLFRQPCGADSRLVKGRAFC
jgi:hypothetical protein